MWKLCGSCVEACGSRACSCLFGTVRNSPEHCLGICVSVCVSLCVCVCWNVPSRERNRDRTCPLSSPFLSHPRIQERICCRVISMQVDISSRYSLSQPPRSSRSVSSASGVVALLKEPSPDVRVFALRALNRLADEHWSEIAEEVHSLCVFLDSLLDYGCY